MASATRHRLGAVLIYVVAVLMGLSTLPKFLRLEPIVENFTRWHLIEQLTLVAVLEVGCVVLLVWPRSYVWGLLAASGYLGGAIVAHLAAGEPWGMGPHGPGAVAPAVLLGLLWLGAWLRRPSLFEV